MPSNLSEKFLRKALSSPLEMALSEIARTARVEPDDLEQVRRALQPGIEFGAGAVAVNPTLLSDALRGVNLLAHELEREAKLVGLKPTAVAEALRKLCPLFPFC